MKNIILLWPFLLLACSGQSSEQSPETRRSDSSAGSLTWEAPAGWVEESPSSLMRKAQFLLPRAENDTEDGSVVLFHFPGGGSAQANLQRWYGQFKQPAGRSSADVADIKQSTVNGLKQTTVELTGTFLFKQNMMSQSATEKPNFKMLAAVIETNSGPWFVKCVGPEKTVGKWQSSFDEFLATLKM